MRLNSTETSIAPAYARSANPESRNPANYEQMLEEHLMATDESNSRLRRMIANLSATVHKTARSFIWFCAGKSCSAECFSSATLSATCRYPHPDHSSLSIHRARASFVAIVPYRWEYPSSISTSSPARSVPTISMWSLGLRAMKRNANTMALDAK